MQVEVAQRLQMRQALQHHIEEAAASPEIDEANRRGLKNSSSPTKMILLAPIDSTVMLFPSIYGNGQRPYIKEYKYRYIPVTNSTDTYM